MSHSGRQLNNGWLQQWVALVDYSKTSFFAIVCYSQILMHAFAFHLRAAEDIRLG
jgi:hypothetical protein